MRYNQELGPSLHAGCKSADGLGMTLCLDGPKHLACPVLPTVHTLWSMPHHHCHQPQGLTGSAPNHRFFP